VSLGYFVVVRTSQSVLTQPTKYTY